MPKTTVAIVGATGVVRAEALACLLRDPRVDHMVAMGRRPLAIQDAKLVSQVLAAWGQAAIAAALPDRVDVALCSLGTTRKAAGSAAALRAVGLDAVVALGRATQSRGAQRLVLVSVAGADARSDKLFLRTNGKAMAELALDDNPESLRVIENDGLQRWGQPVTHR